MALLPKLESFLWGEGGRALTPEQVARERELATLKAQRSVDTSPVGHWSAGAARMVDALGGVLGERRARKAEEEGMASADSVIAALLSPGASSFAPAAPLDAGGIPDVSVQPAPQADVSGAFAGAGAGVMPLGASLTQNESGGNWSALNSEGYGGRGQFGEARLADAARAGIIPAGMTGAQYSQQPADVQRRVEQWHRGDILGQLGNYVGVDVDGPGPIPPMTEDSLVAVAHLGGTGGARRFIESGGQYNPADSNGTRLSDYATRHRGAGGGIAPIGGAGAPPATGVSPVVSALMQASNNPWVQQKYGPVIQALMGQEMQRQNATFEQQLRQQDPMNAAKLEQINLQNEALRNPPPPDRFQTISGEQAASLGLDPNNAYNVGADGKITQIGGGGTNVSVSVGGEGAPELGKLSSDYGYVLDPETRQPVIDPATGLPTAAPVPGSPAARELQQAQQQSETKSTQAASAASIVVQDIDKAIGQVSGWTAGAGSALARIPGSGARDLQASLDTVVANIGFDRLQQMREASPTGGALGGIAVEELKMLQAVMGSLTTAQSPEQLKANLQRLKQVYEPIAAKAAAYPNAAEFGFGGASAASGASPQQQGQRLRFNPETGDFE